MRDAPEHSHHMAVVAKGGQQALCLLARDQIDDPLERLVAVGGLQGGQPVWLLIVGHPLHPDLFEPLMVAWTGAGKYPRSLLEGQLHRKAADAAASAGDEQRFPVQARQLGQRLPGGETGTGQGGGRLVAQGIGHRQQGARRYPGVTGKAAVVAQIGVVGDPGAETQMADVGAERHDRAHAIDAGHLTVLPVGVAIFDQLPVHRIEGDDPVGH